MADTADQTVVLKLEADLAGAIQAVQRLPDILKGSMDQVVNHVNRMAESSSDAFTKIAEGVEVKGEEVAQNFFRGLMLVAGASAVEFVSKMREMLDKATEYSEQLSTLSVITGDNPEELQKLEYAFRSVGVSAEQSQMQMAMFQRRVEETASKSKDTSSIFYRMGLDAKSMVGNDVSKNFDIVADKIRNLRTSSEQSTAAMELFGSRVGARLLPALTQGSHGIDELKNSASGMGAVISDEVLVKLEGLASAMSRFEQTLRAFAADFLSPIILPMQHLYEAAMRLMGAFENLSPMQKMLALVSTLGIAFSGVELAIRVVGVFFRNFVTSELIGFLRAWSGVFFLLISLSSMFATAWITNFAGIRDILAPVINDAVAFFTRMRTAVDEALAGMRAELGPSFIEFENAMQPLLISIADMIDAFLRSPSAINTMHATINILTEVLKDVLHLFSQIADKVNEVLPIIEGALKSISDKINALGVNSKDVAKWVESLAAAFVILAGLRGIALATIALIEFIKWLTVVTIGGTIESIIAIATAFGVGLVGAIGAATAAVWAFFTAESVATLGLAAVIGGLIFLITLLVQNWNNAKGPIIGVLEAIGNAIKKYFVELLRDALDAWSKLLGAIGRLIDSVPGLDAAMGGLADKLFAAANEAERLAIALNTIANAPPIPTIPAVPGGDEEGTAEANAERDFALHAHDRGGGITDAPKKHATVLHHGDQGLLPPQKAGGGGGETATQQELAGMKEALKQLELAIQADADRLKTLGEEYKILGEIDTPEKLARAHQIISLQIEGNIKQQRDYHRELVVLTADAAKVGAQLKGVSGSKDKKDEQATRELRGEFDQLNEKIRQTKQHLEDVHYKLIELRKQGPKIDITFEDKIAGDKSKSFGTRDEAYRKEIAALHAEHAPLDEINKKERERLLLIERRQELVNKAQDIAGQAQIESIDASQKQRDLQPLGRDPAGLEEHARKLADAFDDITKNEIKLTSAQRDEILAKQRLADLERTGASGEDVAEARNQLAQSDLALRTATNDLTFSQDQYLKTVQDTSLAVIETRNVFDSLAKSAAPALYNIVVDISQGMNPLVAIIKELFEKSKAFHDILVVMEEVTQALADVFDALRPVIDLLLGIVVGVVNVFLELYNIMATILNVFGLQIEKIALLNTNLDQLNKNVPLLQVTHDLPTANEYNSGKMADLLAKQNDSATNMNADMNTGFNNQLAKLGEVLGVLVGIYALIQAYLAMQAAAAAGGWIQAFMGLLGPLGGFFSGLFGSGAGSSPQNANGPPPVSFGGGGPSEDPASSMMADSMAVSTDEVHKNTDALKTLNDALTTGSSTGTGGLIGAVNAMGNGLSALGSRLNDAVGGIFGGSGSTTSNTTLGNVNLPGAVGSLFQNVIDLNLASHYGNGRQFTAPGAGNGSSPEGTPSLPTVTINIGNITGTDSVDKLKAQLSKVMDDVMGEQQRKIERSYRTNQFVPMNGNGL